MAVDAIAIPAHCEPLGVAGLYNTLAHIQKANKMRGKANRPPLHILGVVPNMYRSNTDLHKLHLEEIQRNLLPNHIRVLDPLDLRVVWGEASRAGQTVYAYAPTTKAASQMATLAAQLLEQEQNYAE